MAHEDDPTTRVSGVTSSGVRSRSRARYRARKRLRKRAKKLRGKAERSGISYVQRDIYESDRMQKVLEAHRIARDRHLTTQESDWLKGKEKSHWDHDSSPTDTPGYNRGGRPSHDQDPHAHKVKHGSSLLPKVPNRSRADFDPDFLNKYQLTKATNEWIGIQNRLTALRRKGRPIVQEMSRQHLQRRGTVSRNVLSGRASNMASTPRTAVSGTTLIRS